MSGESPEHLVDAFKAAALSVTKLYKTAATAQAKARSDGYQDCLDDLLSYLDRENIGLGDGEGWRIRQWATERLDGRDAVSQQPGESDDEAEKAETMSSPELHATATPANAAAQTAITRQESHPRMDSAPPAIIPHSAPATTAATTESDMVVPSQETFTFQSSHPYPRLHSQESGTKNQESYLNLANLDLSDSRPHEATLAQAAAAAVAAVAGSPHARSSRRLGGSNNNSSLRANARTSAHMLRTAGQKRKLNIAEIFDLSSIGHTKDIFGSGGKRSRHA